MEHRLTVGDSTFAHRLTGLRLRDRLLLLALVIALCLFYLDPIVLRLARELDPAARAFFRFITDIGKSGWILALTAVWFLLFAGLSRRAATMRQRVGHFYVGQLAAFVFLSVAATGIAVNLAKNIIGRARPRHFDEFGSLHFSPFAFRSDFASFPSGHSTTIFALATALAILWPKARVPLFAAAILIGVSRIMVGAHFLSDVIAGAVVGTGGTLLVRASLARRRWLFMETSAGPVLRGRLLAPRIAARLRLRRKSLGKDRGA